MKKNLGNKTSSRSEIGNKISELKIGFDELESLMQTIDSIVKPVKNPQKNSKEKVEQEKKNHKTNSIKIYEPVKNPHYQWRL